MAASLGSVQRGMDVFQHTRSFFLFAVFLSSFLFFTPPTFSQENADADHVSVNDLLRRSVAANLANHRYWHLLLHYRPNRIRSGYTSEIDDPQFFLSPHGKTDPQAELTATLTTLFSPAPVERFGQPAPCAYIARYQWLKSILSIDDHSLPPLHCELFAQWFAELNPDAVTLVFPSAYMQNPASMFGHTFLRIDQPQPGEHTRLLAYAINYGARNTSRNRLEYVIAGVSGGFRGEFALKSYYEMVKEYGDSEDRELWEYQLNFSAAQIRRMLMHLWELKNAYFDYFFFKENCAYHLLSLLEIAAPELHLTDHFAAWTIPADTIRLIAQQPGLITQTTYRPAPGTRIRQQQAWLSGQEKSLFTTLLHNPPFVDSPSLSSLPRDRQAFLLDLVAEYLHYQRSKDPSQATALSGQLHRVLVARSRLATESTAEPIEPFVTQPDRGHGSLRSSFGGGWRQDDWFEEVTVRAGYHDLLDPDTGYTPDSQIEALAVSLRHYEKHDCFRLERLTLADIISLSPWDSLLPLPSWKVRIGLETVKRAQCAYCNNWTANGGLGVTTQTHWLRREVYFAFTELDANYSSAFARHYRIGGGGRVGTLLHLSERWKVLASGAYLHYPLGDTGGAFQAAFGSSYAIQQNLVVRFEYRYREQDQEASLQFHAYF